MLGEGWLSTARNEYNLSMDAAERWMVFARSDADFAHARIYFSRRQGLRWETPVELQLSSLRYKDSDPWLTPDGRTLYFISDRPLHGDEPNGSLDIWRVSFDDGHIGVPEHLDVVASPKSEMGPELHDGWLYFNSSRPGGPAKVSLYRAKQVGDGFSLPEPLGAPFNDGQRQGDFTLSPDGRRAAFWRQAKDDSDEALYMTCRVDGGWSPAIRLPARVNGNGMEFTPTFSADGKRLRFAAFRPADVSAGPDSVRNGQANLFEVATSTLDAAIPLYGKGRPCE